MTFVYLHGMGGSPADWSNVQERLPGRALALPQHHSLAQVIPWLAEEIKEISHPILCGYSMGGRIALLLAEELLRRGRPPAGMALLSTGFGHADEKEREARRLADDRWARLAEQDQEKFWVEWYQQPLFRSFLALAPEIQDAWMKSRKAMNISGLISQLRLLGPAKHEHLLPILTRLREASISVLYLAGELDKKYLDIGQMLAKHEWAAVETIPGAGHILPLEVPQEIAERLRKFFPHPN